MRRHAFVRFVAVVLLLACVGCQAGPSPFRRNVDDYWNLKYEDRPIETTVLSSVLPYYPLLWIGGGFVDTFLINPVQFWSHDLWHLKGAGHVHDQPESANEGIWPFLRSHEEDG